MFMSEMTQRQASTRKHNEAAITQAKAEKIDILNAECNEDAMMDTERADSEEVGEEELEVSVLDNDDKAF